MTYDIVSVVVDPDRAVLDVHAPVRRHLNTSNSESPCQCYQSLLESSDSELLIYVHDDVTIHDMNWIIRIEEIFKQDDSVAVAGLGGAASLGHPDLYKKPYQIEQMARRGYVSNQTDWQTHGEHETGTKRVAVVDAFFMAVRRSFLELVGGWPIKHLTHHCLDLWLACEAARRGYLTYMTGIDCTHHGGGTSTSESYMKAKWLQGGTVEEDHRRPHRWLYEEYRDVLPIQVKP